MPPLSYCFSRSEPNPRRLRRSQIDNLTHRGSDESAVYPPDGKSGWIAMTVKLNRLNDEASLRVDKNQRVNASRFSLAGFFLITREEISINFAASHDVIGTKREGFSGLARNARQAHPGVTYGSLWQIVAVTAMLNKKRISVQNSRRQLSSSKIKTILNSGFYLKFILFFLRK